jgi:GT2 family glycosyltransferase
MTMSARLSIIFVNWNSTEYLRQCLTGVIELNETAGFELIVVDNASPDGDVDSLKRLFPEIQLLKNSKNIGFGSANNIGFRHSTGDNILFLNPDTKLVGSAINILLAHLDSLKRAGILGCRLLNSDLSIQTSCIQTFPTILNQALDSDFLRKCWPRSPLWGTWPLFDDSPTPAKVEVISGACMMVKRDVFERIGMFNEQYFMYAEDLDLCRKAIRAGYNNYLISEAAIIHHGGKSSNPQIATVIKWQSILQYLVKHHGRTYAVLFRVVMSVMALFRLGLLAPGVLRGAEDAGHGSGYSAARKWKAILKTLVTHSGSLRVTPEG